MKYYIVDDVNSIIKILGHIIEEKELGEVVGSSLVTQTAISEIIALNPDIVFVDLLMPVKDGISLVREVRQLRPRIHFIMISQVSDKEMIAEAYQAGVEFFIHKPINIIEVETVTRRVLEKIRLSEVLGGIREFFEGTEPSLPVAPTPPKDDLKDLKYLLGLFGMLGESGTKDILAICETLLQDGQGYDKGTIEAYAASQKEAAKSVKQRMRRAVKKGLTNIASMGIEDYYNEVFQSYSQVVFDFDNIKSEMDYLRGNAPGGGKVNLDKFMEGLLILNEVKD